MNKSKIVSFITYFLLIPITIIIGVVLLNNKNYLLISLIIVAEFIIPMTALYERKKPKASEIAVMSVLCAVCIASRAVFYPFPQMKPVLALIIIFASVIGAERGFIIGAVSMLVSGFIFGLGPWTPFQMFASALIGYISGIVLSSKTNKYITAVFGAFLAIIVYGGIMNPASLIVIYKSINIKMLIASYITGFPLDLIHAVTTFFIIILFRDAFSKKLKRLALKFGIFTVK